ncbi:hypothetical protein ACU5AX_01435 [Sphingomonas sp. XXL09]|uniref:hypothetical protein n=1 Tax=Sphingomonas sp. XXL09 TaxID=3457787 RepID=UPI00406BB2A6
MLTPKLAKGVERAKRLGVERRQLEAVMPARHRYVDGWPLHVPTYDEALTIFDAREVILAHHGVTSPYDSPAKIIDRFASLKAEGQAYRARKLAA